MIAERNEQGKFVKGNASNGGRPKGLAEKARAACGDGTMLVAFFLDVLKNEKANTRDRVSAAEWFSDRGWGKAIQQIDEVSDGKLIVEIVRVAGVAKSQD